MPERERCSPLIIIERAFRSFGVVLFAILCNLAGNLDEGDLEGISRSGGLIIIIPAALILLLLLYFWLSWRNTYITMADDNLIVESGIISKRKISIPIAQINTIDKGQNIFQRILGTEVLKVDTGAIAGSADKRAEIDLLFTVKRGDEIRELILNRGQQYEALLRAAGDSPVIERTEPKWCIKASFGDFFMYGLTSSSVVKLLLYIFGIAAFVAQLSQPLLSRIEYLIAPYLNAAADVVSRSAVIAIIIAIAIILLAIIVISNIADIIWAAIRFYDFRVARDGDNIVIRYGLFALKNYTLPVRNIHALTIKQNLMQQLMHKSCIEVVTVGYGNEKEETALLFPIIANKKIDALLAELLPEYVVEMDMRYSGKKGVRYNIIYPVIAWGIILAGAAVGLLFVFRNPATAVALPLILWLLILWSRILNHKHTAVGCNERAVDVQSGGFVKVRTHIRTDAVQSATTRSGIFKRRRNIADIVVSYHAPVIRSSVTARSFDTDYLYEIAKFIED